MCSPCIPGTTDYNKQVRLYPNSSSQPHHGDCYTIIAQVLIQLIAPSVSTIIPLIPRESSLPLTLPPLLHRQHSYHQDNMVRFPPDMRRDTLQPSQLPCHHLPLSLLPSTKLDARPLPLTHIRLGGKELEGYRRSQGSRLSRYLMLSTLTVILQFWATQPAPQYGIASVASSGASSFIQYLIRRGIARGGWSN